MKPTPALRNIVGNGELWHLGEHLREWVQNPPETRQSGIMGVVVSSVPLDIIGLPFHAHLVHLSVPDRVGENSWSGEHASHCLECNLFLIPQLILEVRQQPVARVLIRPNQYQFVLR